MKHMQHSYKMIDLPPLTAEQLNELEYLKNMPDSEIDYSDIPEKLETPVMPYYFQSSKIPKADVHTKIDTEEPIRSVCSQIPASVQTASSAATLDS